VIRNTAPAPKPRVKRPHAAAGGRIAASGIAASAVLGLTGVIASANRPEITTAVATTETTVPTVAAAPITETIPTVVGDTVPAPSTAVTRR
jgi:hypothetical protein